MYPERLKNRDKALALCDASLRKNGLHLERFLRNMPDEWGKLHEARKLIKREAQSLIDDESRGKEADRLSAADGLTDVLDAIDEHMDAVKARERGEPTPAEIAELEDKRRREEGREEFMAVNREFHAVGAEPREPRTRLLAPEHRVASRVQRRSDFDGELSIQSCLRAALTGAKTDAEHRALTEGTDAAGGFTVPSILSAQLIDLVREQSAVMRAGASTVLLGSDENSIARVASDPTPGWRDELGTVAESEPTFDRVLFEPQSLSVMVKVSRELLMDTRSGLNLPGIIAAAMGQELDRAALLGTGTAPEPAGLDTLAGVLELPHDAAVTDYSPFLTARRNLQRNNVDGLGAVILHPDLENVISGLADSTGQPLAMPPALDRPTATRWITSNKLPTDRGTGTDETIAFCGDFSSLVMGVRENVSVFALRERYADTGEIAFVSHMRADFAILRPNRIIKISGITL